MTEVQEDLRPERRWDRSAFWGLLFCPFVIASFSDFFVKIFVVKIPESMIAYSYFLYLLICFSVSLVCFHVAAFVFGPRVFGERKIEKCISYIDYVWYFFGGVAISYFAVGEFQDRYFTKSVEEVTFAAETHDTLLAGAFYGLYPACRALVQHKKLDAGAGPEIQELIGFCYSRVATQNMDVGFEPDCALAMQAAKKLSPEELRDFALSRTARGGREISDLGYLCENARGLEQSAASERQAASKVGGWIGRSGGRLFWTYVLTALLVALKFTKVTAGIRKLP